MKKFILTTMILLYFSTMSALAHGYIPGRLEDAVTKIDQVVIAKITAIKETPIYHILKNGTQGALLTTQREYTLEVNRILAGSDNKPNIVSYTAPQIECYDENGELLFKDWIKISGTGLETDLQQGQEYILCLRQDGVSQSSYIIRAESSDRAEVVMLAMKQVEIEKINLQIKNIDSNTVIDVIQLQEEIKMQEAMVSNFTNGHENLTAYTTNDVLFKNETNTTSPKWLFVSIIGLLFFSFFAVFLLIRKQRIFKEKTK